MSAVLLGDPLTPKRGPTEEEEEFSFLLVDEEETLQVKDVADFIKRLGCSPQEPVKVLSIFGNTGDGKSHTLNHMFFGGLEIFRTSPSQDSCTVGVWASYYPELSLVCCWILKVFWGPQINRTNACVSC
ncbi:unnamed protein product [Staurois parvus]|uniref:Uncharacterized protein n=1 Tax=Staurois parvus TaxID=386267 RepID=A0ABN9ACN4_9NEOB|nr:unnamed protein product [Staurois parvus]